MAKMKKYQGDTGKSSVDPVSAMNAFLMQQAENNNAASNNKEKAEALEIERKYQENKKQADKKTKDAIDRLKNTKNYTFMRMKKGGPVTALDQVDKMYKAKYKK